MALNCFNYKNNQLYKRKNRHDIVNFLEDIFAFHLNIKQNCFKTRYDGSPVGKLKGTMFESLPDVQV